MQDSVAEKTGKFAQLQLFRTPTDQLPSTAAGFTSPYRCLRVCFCHLCFLSLHIVHPAVDACLITKEIHRMISLRVQADNEKLFIWISRLPEKCLDKMKPHNEFGCLGARCCPEHLHRHGQGKLLRACFELELELN
jgi:hypothetical protein